MFNEMLTMGSGGGGSTPQLVVCFGGASPYRQICIAPKYDDTVFQYGYYTYSTPFATYDDDNITIENLGELTNGAKVTLKRGATLSKKGFGVSFTPTHYNAGDTFTLPYQDSSTIIQFVNIFDFD